MDSIHDMGGMHGFGLVPVRDDDNSFQHDWEARTLALNLLLSPLTGNNVDRFRFLIESLPPGDYLSLSYFERWLHSMLQQLEETRALPLAQLEDIRLGNVPSEQETKSSKNKSADQLAELFMHNTPMPPPRMAKARFKPGDKVRSQKMHSAGHTRLPRYARGRLGEVIFDNGDFIFADDNAALKPAALQRVYTVRFKASELWGSAANANDSVNLDLWDSYLEPS
ncbi:MAG: nitrile hydratase subunit beta [Pseudomonadales bacterium]